MKRFHLLMVVAVGAILWPTLGVGHPATVIIDWVWGHLGGKDAYEKARYVQFTFASEGEGRKGAERKHLWDRYTGDYVLEFGDAGATYKVYFNIDSKEGVVVKNGAILEGDAAAKQIDHAYAIFCNDTYWLLVPTKLGDYGARTQFVGHLGINPEDEFDKIAYEEMMERAEGKEHHHHERKPVPPELKDTPAILHLWFEEKVGVTPGDQYWLYVKHDGRIDKWRYKLQDGTESEWTWSDEKDCGLGLTFSTRRTRADGKRVIYFPDVKFSETMDRSVFTYQG